MQLVTELSGFGPERGTLLTVGVFDGVHLGHQHLVRLLTERASRDGLLGGVVTFKANPKVVLSPKSRPARLTTIEERARLLKSLGVDFVVPITFDTEVAGLGAREFILLLQEHLRMRGLVIGPNFALGRGRKGNAAALQALGRELGFGVEVVEPLVRSGTVVSSTAIREALSRGDMRTTSDLLGRHFRLSGSVVGGTERGRGLGFPTANIQVDSEQALPVDGVYATLGHVGASAYRSVTSIGVRPTFGKGGERTIEAYLMDFAGELYGQQLAIDLVEHLRGERKFAGPAELAAQIARDVGRARTILA